MWELDKAGRRFYNEYTRRGAQNASWAQEAKQTAGRRPGQQSCRKAAAKLPEKGCAQTAPAPEEWEYEEWIRVPPGERGVCAGSASRTAAHGGFCRRAGHCRCAADPDGCPGAGHAAGRHRRHRADRQRRLHRDDPGAAHRRRAGPAGTAGGRGPCGKRLDLRRRRKRHGELCLHLRRAGRHPDRPGRGERHRGLPVRRGTGPAGRRCLRQRHTGQCGHLLRL